MNAVSLARWSQLMNALDLSGTDTTRTYDALVAAYSEKHRHYHTLEHIDACLRHLDRARHLAVLPAQIEIALWFHDAVYDTYGKENEERSARLAVQFLHKHGAASDCLLQVERLILATQHQARVSDSDEQLLVDIDLAILGSEPTVYDEFESNVRKEYKWVPMPLYRRKRCEILQSFLDQERIYYTEHFRQSSEDQARSNLMRAIARLRH
jgi:predicted metal-dependent HD superfamily phosphohydrolase